MYGICFRYHELRHDCQQHRFTSLERPSHMQAMDTFAANESMSCPKIVYLPSEVCGSSWLESVHNGESVLAVRDY